MCLFLLLLKISFVLSSFLHYAGAGNHRVVRIIEKAGIPRIYVNRENNKTNHGNKLRESKDSEVKNENAEYLITVEDEDGDITYKISYDDGTISHGDDIEDVDLSFVEYFIENSRTKDQYVIDFEKSIKKPKSKRNIQRKLKSIAININIVVRTY